MAVFCIFAAASPNFLNPTNLLNILKQVSFLAILGLGFGLAFIAAELDLSFASVCSFAAVVVGGLIHHRVNPALALAAGPARRPPGGALNRRPPPRLQIPSPAPAPAPPAAPNGPG